MENIKYKVIRIDEPDFGCEGLPEGKPLLDEVLLEDENGNKIIIKADDKLLYKLNVNEGDYITSDIINKLKI